MDYIGSIQDLRGVYLGFMWWSYLDFTWSWLYEIAVPAADDDNNAAADEEDDNRIPGMRTRLYGKENIINSRNIM